MKEMNIAIIGYQFMGKAHSNAWLKAPQFFNLNIKPVLKVACGRHEDALKAFAKTWGWQETETDWRKVVERDDIDIIDVSVPTLLHHDIVAAAAKAGKHIFCEKPLALDYEHAKQMYEAVQGKPIKHFLNHNYRKCPAVMLAKQLIDEGRIGQIYHWRGTYLQDWIVDPNFPLTWQLQKEIAGAGPHNDLNSHSVDLARYLVGDIASVCCMTKTFIKERPIPEAPGQTAFGASSKSAKKGAVTVDDASFMVVEFKNGALGAFEASRFALGRKNFNYFEIYGSKGSLAFNLERMNELQFYSSDDPEHARGFRTIIATESVHPFVGAWWPPGHIIGYEHEFVHAVVEFLNAIDKDTEVHPNFYDGLKCMQVLSAALESAATGKKVVIE